MKAWERRSVSGHAKASPRSFRTHFRIYASTHLRFYPSAIKRPPSPSFAVFRFFRLGQAVQSQTQEESCLAQRRRDAEIEMNSVGCLSASWRLCARPCGLRSPQFVKTIGKRVCRCHPILEEASLVTHKAMQADLSLRIFRVFRVFRGWSPLLFLSAFVTFVLFVV